MIRRLVHVPQERSVVDAEFMYHLADADDIVVAAADEAHERFPGVLLEDAHARELGCFFCEVWVLGGPLLVETCEIWAEVEVVFDELERVVVVGRGTKGRGWVRGRRCWRFLKC